MRNFWVATLFALITAVLATGCGEDTQEGGGSGGADDGRTERQAQQSTSAGAETTAPEDTAEETTTPPAPETTSDPPEPESAQEEPDRATGQAAAGEQPPTEEPTTQEPVPAEPPAVQEKTSEDAAPAEEAAGNASPESGSGSHAQSPGLQTAREQNAGREAPFIASPEASGGTSGGASGIRDVRFASHQGYERLVVDFGAGGAPAASVPEWSLASPTGEGYARIALPGVGATATTDAQLGGSIMDSFYVVRAPGGGMFIDIFATGAFQYRVIELSEPGRLAIDYRSSVTPLAIPLPERNENTVVTQPREGQPITGPLTVSGYSRNFEASNNIVLLGPGGEVLAQKNALGNDWADTWGYFETTLQVPAFQGQGTLQVGTQSARDGSFEGVELPVSYGG